MRLNLYLLRQSKVTGYDTYDSAVVAAETVEDAVMIHPDKYMKGWLEAEPPPWEDFPEGEVFMTWVGDGGFTHSDAWPAPEHVTTTLIGVAETSIERGVVCASFNAG